MPRTAKRTYHHGDLRQALVSAAVTTISEQGEAHVSLRALARDLGVSSAAPYHHFPDKGALLAAVAADGFEGLAAAMDEATAELGDAPPRERMEAMGVAYMTYALGHAAHYRMMFMSELRDHCATGALEANGRAAFERLLALVAEVRPDRTPENMMQAALTCWSTVHGFATLAQMGAVEAKFLDGEDAFGEAAGPDIDALIAAVSRRAAESVAHGD